MYFLIFKLHASHLLWLYAKEQHESRLLLTKIKTIKKTLFEIK